MRSLLIATAVSGLIATAPVLAQDESAPEPATDATYDASTVLATVDGTEITLGNLIVLRGRLPEQYQQVPDESLFPGLVEQLIDQTLLSQQVSTSEADDPAEVKIVLENERRGALAAIAVNEVIADPIEDTAVQAAYDEMFADFTPETEYNAAHILVEDEAKANELLAEVEGGADFAEVAKANSTDGSAANGGELGWFGTGRMVPEFETAVSSMEAGEVAGPIQTQFGWHIIRLNETRESTPPALEEVRPQIEDQIRQQQVQDHIASLRESASIEQPETSVPASAIRDTDLLSN